MEWQEAVAAAQAFVNARGSDQEVVASPDRVLFNDEVFVLERDPMSDDDQMLVVHRDSGRVELVVVPAWEPAPFAGLEPVEEPDESDAEIVAII